ncbi:hypothetical protein Rsub_01647 [Raphidocelis subcapitata]|uniref:Flagellar associated protein n=1 Tax=Raphidocelis subcapitata TaxID=307507 RepID=A0A2V0NML0_9CHLO|nr:hypothetical protein Rsub_01647 [Raphidocelis subcapitata]|eukprot:GBF88746.1 hypothetical protein Rsub_01647 [Raphidocelis subcapitata]
MIGPEKDPSIRWLRSSFGSQVASRHSSAPAAGFGTSTRESALRIYASREQAKKLPGNNSQGPVYRVYSSIGRQPESARANAGAAPFGTAQRLPRHGGRGAPGPGHYRSPGGLGAQAESARPTSPRAVFGTCTREGLAKVYLDAALMRAYYGKESPPPGAYNLRGSVGPQVVSNKETAPSARIGTGLRALDCQVARFGRGSRDTITKKTFISKAHEKSGFGLHTPGPCTASPYVGTGTAQLLSTRLNSPSIAFGTGKRMRDYCSDAPGPGSYYA